MIYPRGVKLIFFEYTVPDTPSTIEYMTYPTTVLLEPDIKYAILSEDGSSIYVTFTLPRSPSATSEHADPMGEDWDKYNVYTGYVVIALNVCTIAALVAHTIFHDTR